MKKSTLITSITFAFMMLLSANVNAQKFPNVDKSPMDMASYPTDYKNANKLVKITYSRPQLNGRALSELAPSGKIWRTGANEAPEITFYTDMNLGKTKIKAGTYSLVTIPGDNELTVILSKDLNVWGAYFYKAENDVARLTVPLTEADESLESFSMVFTETANGAKLNMGWDKMRAAIPFTK